jgi:hypothetical protein
VINRKINNKIGKLRARIVIWNKLNIKIKILGNYWKMNKIVVLLFLAVPCLSQHFSPAEFVAQAIVPGLQNEIKSNNELLHQEVLTSYSNNNNHFNTDDQVSFLSAPINHVFNGDGLAEGRILNGKSVNFGNTHLLNGLFRDVSKIRNFIIFDSFYSFDLIDGFEKDTRVIWESPVSFTCPLFLRLAG